MNWAFLNAIQRIFLSKIGEVAQNRRVKDGNECMNELIIICLRARRKVKKNDLLRHTDPKGNRFTAQ